MHVHLGEKRTVGSYQVYHDGVAQTAPELSGDTAETKDPGKNHPKDNGLRIQQGYYPLQTWGGKSYATYGYEIPSNRKKPAIEIKGVLPRTEILFHPGERFLSSIGCINLCSGLRASSDMIYYPDSRQRVIAVIEDMKKFLGARFPQKNDLPIQDAFIAIDGEPR
jgi:hypothetical protein